MAIDPKCLRLHLVSPDQLHCYALSLARLPEKAPQSVMIVRTPQESQLLQPSPSTFSKGHDHTDSYSTPLRPAPWAEFTVLGMASITLWGSPPSTHNDHAEAVPFMMIHHHATIQQGQLPLDRGRTLGERMYLNRPPQLAVDIATLPVHF